MSEARKQVESAINTAELAIEEAISWLSEDLSIGDDGVAEAIIRVENDLMIVSGRLNKYRNTH